MYNYDLLVIGGGPAGYYAAIRGAQLGAKVAVAENNEFGGTCLNRGCIPTKTMLEIADVRGKILSAENLGLLIQGTVAIDMDRMIARKEKVVQSLRNGLKMIVKKNDVNIIQGKASFTGRNEIEIESKNGKAIYKAKKVIIATGSKERALSISGGELAIGSTEGLNLKELPDRVCIIGAGAVGLEFATIFSGLGVKVSILELLPQILSGEDQEMASILKKILAQRGIIIRNSCRIMSIKRDNDEYQVLYTEDDAERTETTGLVFNAAGRIPVTEGLNLKEVGIRIDSKGFIKVNEYLETTAQGIFAAGDVIGGYLLAHVAFAEGKAAADNALCEKKPYISSQVPRCVYTHPEFAAVGITEEEANAQGIHCRAGRFPFSANGRAMSMNETSGCIKVIADTDLNQIFGIHIVGPFATELITAASCLISGEFTCEELASMMLPHPTLGEALKEAGMDYFGLAVHK